MAKLSNRTAVQTAIDKHSKRSEAASKAWTTRRAAAQPASVVEETTPSATLLMSVDEAIRLGWSFVLSKSAEGHIQGGATLPLCNGDHVVTELVTVDDDWNEASSKRILVALMGQIESYYMEEDR